MTVTLGSELREALDGLYGGGTTTNEGLDGLAGEETARARAASLFSDGDVERLRLSLVLSCRTPGCVLTNFEKKPGAILCNIRVSTRGTWQGGEVTVPLSCVRRCKSRQSCLVSWRLFIAKPMEPSPLKCALYAVGSNGRGQLATADLQDARSFTPCTFNGCQRGTLPPGTVSVIAIKCGGNHSLALLSRLINSPNPRTRIEVWGSGDGTKGQLGPTYVNEAAIFRPIALPLEVHGLSGYEISDGAACWETSFFVLTKDGQHDLLISMGGDDFGDLGIGTARKALPFHIITFTHIVGPVPHRLSITDIAAGPHHVIVLLRADNKQHIAGWGAARHGQLGPLHAPSGRALPYSPSPVAINLPIDIQLDPVRSVRAGNQHTLFLHASGRVSTLGSDAKGQLRGLHSAPEDVQAIGCSWNGSYLRTRTGLLSAGANAHGQLGREGGSEMGHVSVPDTVVDFACGSEHVLCVLGQGEVWGWGWNEHGNLATGSLDDVKAPVRIWPPASHAQAGEKTGDAVGVWAGCGTSWIAVSLHETG
jgi:protein ATS1